MSVALTKLSYSTAFRKEPFSTFPATPPTHIYQALPNEPSEELHLRIYDLAPGTHGASVKVYRSPTTLSESG